MSQDIDESNHAQAEDLRALALQLAAFTGVLEQRGEQVVQETHDAVQRLDRAAHGLAATSERLAASAIEHIRQAAATAVASGLRQPLEDAGRSMQDGTQQLQRAIRELEERTRRLGKALSAHAAELAVRAGREGEVDGAIKNVSLLVNPEQYQLLMAAEKMGELDLSLRNRADVEKTDVAELSDSVFYQQDTSAGSRASAETPAAHSWRVSFLAPCFVRVNMSVRSALAESSRTTSNFVDGSTTTR